MSLSLTNRDDVVANSISLIQQQGLYDVGVNVIDVVASLLNKGDKTTVYTKTETFNKPEVLELLNDLSDTTVADQLVLKANIDDVNIEEVQIGMDPYILSQSNIVTAIDV